MDEEGISWFSLAFEPRSEPAGKPLSCLNVLDGAYSAAHVAERLRAHLGTPAAYAELLARAVKEDGWCVARVGGRQEIAALAVLLKKAGLEVEESWIGHDKGDLPIPRSLY